MMCTVNSQQCDYLRSHTTSYVFASERAELVHINEQISSLDNHISQLNALRDTLHRRSCQLQNLLSPIRALPVEVLSRIFKHVIDSVGYFYYGRDPYLVSLHQALVLSSVTTHFRYVAFGTPELWKKIPLALYGMDAKSTDKASALLQHCIARASNVDISISDKLKLKGHIRSAMNLLLDPDTMQKIKAFQLSSAYGLKLWIEKLQTSSLPTFDTLTLNIERWKKGGLDMRTLNTVTRLTIRGAMVHAVSPFIMPPSVQHLKITNMPQQVLISFLYQCPNLVECTATINTPYLVDGSKFTKPLTLYHLKRLTIGIMDALETSSSVQNFQLPSLEFLDIKLSTGDTSLGPLLLCRNVSATLTTLTINLEPDILTPDDLYQLCRLPFPKLRELEFVMFSDQCHRASPLNVVRALTPQNDECNDSKFQRLPSLRSLSLYYSSLPVEPYLILDMLKQWRVGETSYFHLKVSSYSLQAGDNQWPPELQDELRLVIGSRQVEVTWNRIKLL